ncbi:type 1 fimbrial protein [Salmonella enterica subsp. enterica serovar Lexington]|uniref:Type-1 fimbrial major subunit n=2 Tax=Salmonella enterica TaxID=28901 RepID=A0A379YLD8_SALER|nr:type 1 fimbrial protein [Salmonella enterica subsp. enterica serovar Lexington]EAO2118200.1 type 1 fimbrial protein [Salmonella enterica]EBP3214347.1 type 1 fimbrial protein [Salmonella enterica subsp. arizonae]ECF5887249.1 type 1 fimbrial protein [Salmonella enterica subsp. indica]ECM3796597.1 type 1 fimbrial protein [Salmonella enterica subsp. enterica serovar Newport]MIG58782.1 type 1 fimbrial protein [Salmonella enterica subsp. houtenae]
MMTKSLVAGALTVLLGSFGVNAASQGQGVVNFKGTVIDAPCGIAPESADQSVDFGQISKSHLAAGGISVQKNLDIKLVNCDVTGLTKGVQLTFSGNTVNGTATELATAGTTNTAIVINGYGNDVTFGTATDHVRLVEGDNTLRFLSWAKQATGKAVAEGDFTAIANFNLTYE